MRIVRNGETVRISEIKELDASSSEKFHSIITAGLPVAFTYLDIDLSRTGFIDCGGVGALIALHKRARRRNAKATLRLLNPSTPARRIFQLTRLDRLFPINSIQPNGLRRSVKKQART